MKQNRTLKHIIETLKNRRQEMKVIGEIAPDDFGFLIRMAELLINKYDNNELIDISEITNYDPSILSNKNYN